MFIRTAIAVFAAATIIETGAAFAQTAPQQNPPAVTAPAQGHHHRSRMALFRGLNLTADQKTKMKAIRSKYQAEMMSVLTPDQQQKVQQRLAAMRSRMRR